MKKIRPSTARAKKTAHVMPLIDCSFTPRASGSS
jgi:hypothetical protein